MLFGLLLLLASLPCSSCFTPSSCGYGTSGTRRYARRPEMEVWQLRDWLDTMVGDDIPAADLAKAIIDIAEMDNWDSIEPLLGKETTETVKAAYRKNPEEWKTTWKTIAAEATKSFVGDSLHRLS